MSCSKNLHVMMDFVFFKDMIQEIYKRELIDFNKFAVKLYHKNQGIRFLPNYPNMQIIPRTYNLQKLAKGYDKIISTICLMRIYLNYQSFLRVMKK